MNREFIREVGPLRWVLRTIQRQFFKRILKRDHTMRLPTGEQLTLPISSLFATEAFVTRGNVDWGSEELLFKLLTKKGVFLDIGANIGYYSLYMLPKVKEVYCFEPDPRMLALLKLNTAHRKEIHVCAQAVGKQDGIARFTLARTGEISHLSREDDSAESIQHVDLVSIDTFVEGHKLAIEAIKIDVEGFDLDVIRGAIHTLQSQRPVVLTEAQPDADLFTLVAQAGYKVFGFVRVNKQSHNEFNRFYGPIGANYHTKMLFLFPEEFDEELITAALVVS